MGPQLPPKARKRKRWGMGHSCLAFDKARHGGFYTRVGDMTSILDEN